jgi:hypothetical protein
MNGALSCRTDGWMARFARDLRADNIREPTRIQQCTARYGQRDWRGCVHARISSSKSDITHQLKFHTLQLACWYESRATLELSPTPSTLYSSRSFFRRCFFIIICCWDTREDFSGKDEWMRCDRTVTVSAMTRFDVDKESTKRCIIWANYEPCRRDRVHSPPIESNHRSGPCRYILTYRAEATECDWVCQREAANRRFGRLQPHVIIKLMASILFLRLRLSPFS